MMVNSVSNVRFCANAGSPVNPLERQGAFAKPNVEVAAEPAKKKSGVKKAVMIDGRIPHSILIEMFSNEGIGTLMSMWG